MNVNIKQKITLIGHPFSPSGRGEDIRCAARSLDSVGMDYSIKDIYGKKGVFQEEYFQEFQTRCNDDWDGDINLFILNADEIKPVLGHLNIDIPKDSYNIIYPQWELGNYPDEWAKELDHFDEIWAPSKFVNEALSKSVTKTLKYIPLSAEINLNSFLPRSYFKLPDSSQIFLFFFDFNSYMERKNPQAILKTVTEVCSSQRYADIRLVLKTSKPLETNSNYQKYIELRNQINNSSISDRVIFIDHRMTDNEIKNLVRCSDCFVSLHRSEGFGRGLAEAMILGKPVIGTNYSGNLDFMSENNSYLVDYKLIPVKEGEYPFSQGQKWAEVKIDHAVELMSKVILEKDPSRDLGERAKIDLARDFSYRSVGLKYQERFQQIRE